jgi:putative redox protein
MMDSEKRFGGTEGAAKPKELFLMALAGCTGMDVASILSKMRVRLDDFELWIDAEEAEEHPKVFTKIRLEYRFFGKEIDTDKVEQAIELSATKYCAVSAMLKKAVEIQSSYRINPDPE